MSVCPCSCVFGADFEQICIAEIEILCVKSLVFHASIDVKFYDFYTGQYAFFCHSSQNFVFDSHLRALYKKKHLRVNSSLWSSQDYTVKFYSYSEYLFMWKTFLSSPVLYTNIKYVSYVWTVLYHYVLTSSNISEIYMTAYFEHTPL